ncbi:MAG TPA: iron ABC transporter substrate-binding protein [Acidimicrobiales bacterium]|nr:iron ABC transporter substrate-binding protein [Acidimicrobiales bacterium]
MPTRRWRAASAVLTLLVLLAPACGGDDGSASGSGPVPSSVGDGTDRELEGTTITVYSGRDEELVQPLIDRFEADTGITVEVRYGDSAEMAAQILEEGSETPADVFYSQEVGAVGALAKADLMGRLPAEVLERVDERFRPHEGTAWVGVTGRSRVIVYNPDLVDDPPESVLDLTDPQYEGQVAWVPGNASFQSFVTAFRVTRGEDAARQWLEDMQANGVDGDYESNVDVLDAVSNGDIALGLINHYYWARALPEVGGAENMGSRLIFPKGDDPGALVNATAVGVLAGAEDESAAQAFVEYLLSEAGQSYFAEEVFEYPLVEGVDDPEGVPPLEELEGPAIDLTDLDSLEETQSLLSEVGLIS